MTSEHYTDEHLRAIGRATVAATAAEWAMAALASWYNEGTPLDYVATPGRAQRELKSAAKRAKDLEILVGLARQLFAERNRLVHDVALHEFVGGPELARPVLLSTKPGDPAFTMRPVPPVAEIDEVAQKLEYLAVLCQARSTVNLEHIAKHLSEDGEL